MGLMKADEYMQMNQGAGATSSYYQPEYGYMQEPEQINSPRLPHSRGTSHSPASSYNPVKPVQNSDRGSYSSGNTYQQVLSKDQLQVHLPPAASKEKLPPSPQEPLPPVRHVREERPGEMGGPNPLYEYTRAQGKCFCLNIFIIGCFSRN
jgi:hypothetical protein